MIQSNSHLYYVIIAEMNVSLLFKTMFLLLSDESCSDDFITVCLNNM